MSEKTLVGVHRSFWAIGVFLIWYSRLAKSKDWIV